MARIAAMTLFPKAPRLNMEPLKLRDLSTRRSGLTGTLAR